MTARTRPDVPPVGHPPLIEAVTPAGHKDDPRRSAAFISNLAHNINDSCRARDGWNGWTFWALAPLDPAWAKPGYEQVWLEKAGRFRRAQVEVDTGYVSRHTSLDGDGVSRD